LHGLPSSFAGPPRSKVLDKLKMDIQHVTPNTIPELDPATAGWVCLLPVAALDQPYWSNLRVRLAQANRAFIMFGSNKNSVPMVEAMRDGAFDSSTRRTHHPLAGRHRKIGRVAIALAPALWRHHAQAGLIIGKSAPITALTQVIQRIGPRPPASSSPANPAPEKKSRPRPPRSLRPERPFLAVNCAAIPKDLIEAELFGAEKGAYTGAGTARPGLVELAPGGTSSSTKSASSIFHSNRNSFAFSRPPRPPRRWQRGIQRRRPRPRRHQPQP